MSEKNPISAAALEKENAELKKLESIREILFGQNVEEYRKEFEEIRKILKADHDRTLTQIKQLTDDFNQKLEQTENQLTTKMQKMEAKFDQLITELKDQKTDRKALSELFSDISKKLE